MAYAASAAVVAMCPHLFNRSGGGPAASDVNAWLDEGQSYIDAKLKGLGYSVPVSSSAQAYAMLASLNALWGAAVAEQTRVVGTTGEAESRGDAFERRFWARLNNLNSFDLSGLGVSHTSKMYIGGISESEKDSVESDTDRIMGSFTRGQFSHPGAGTTYARDAADDEQER